MTVFTGVNQPLILGKTLGSGGEGTVYEVAGQPETVAKIYHQTPDIAKQKKLHAMVAGSHASLEKIALWPKGLVYNAQQEIIGFLMPRLPADSRPVHQIYNPGQRKQDLPDADYAFLVHTARNAAAAVDELHRHGHRIGDINQGNLVVAPDSTVRLIDCDSFQIQVEPDTFLCEVRVGHFLPPELHGQDFTRLATTTNHDSFGLALLIFHILMMGRHPFAGVYSGAGDMPIEKAIAEFRYAYAQDSTRKQMRPPPQSVSITLLPPGIRQLFESAFGETGIQHRPAASEWVRQLDMFERALTRCPVHSQHVFYRDVPHCPWCYASQHQQAHYFIAGQHTVDERVNTPETLSKPVMEPPERTRPVTHSSARNPTSRVGRHPFKTVIKIGVCAGALVVLKAVTGHTPKPESRPIAPTTQVAESIDERARTWRMIDYYGRETVNAPEWAAALDSGHGLMWAVDSGKYILTNDLADTRFEFSAAQDHVTLANRHQLAGHADWRLPTRRDMDNLAGALRSAGRYQHFRLTPNLESACYWLDNGHYAFADSRCDDRYAHILLVRSVPARSADSLPQATPLLSTDKDWTKVDAQGRQLPFATMNAAAVIDARHGLMWSNELDDDYGLIDFRHMEFGLESSTEAGRLLYYINRKRVLAGHDDWRLPTLAELKTLAATSTDLKQVFSDPAGAYATAVEGRIGNWMFDYLNNRQVFLDHTGTTNHVRLVRNLHGGKQASIRKQRQRPDQPWLKLGAHGDVLPGNSPDWCALVDRSTGLVWITQANIEEREQSGDGNWSAAHYWLKEANEKKTCGRGNWHIPSLDQSVDLMVFRQTARFWPSEDRIWAASSEDADIGYIADLNEVTNVSRIGSVNLFEEATRGSAQVFLVGRYGK